MTINKELEDLQKALEVKTFFDNRDKRAAHEEAKRRSKHYELEMHNFDGRPKDSGEMLEALRREHGPQGRPDIYKSKK
jgi:hypothetical protein